MAAVQTITDAQIESEIINSDLPVLIDFYADWCGPCKTLSPRIEELAKEYAGSLKVVKIDVDQNPMSVQMFRIQAMPTLVLVKDRQIADVAQGALDRAQLRALVSPHVKPPGPKGVDAWDAERLKLTLEAGMAIPVDLREPTDFARARIPGAINVPAAGVAEAAPELAAAREHYVFYGRTNDGVEDAAKLANEAGAKVSRLEGGMLAWEAEFFRVERG